MGAAKEHCKNTGLLDQRLRRAPRWLRLDGNEVLHIHPDHHPNHALSLDAIRSLREILHWFDRPVT